MRFFMVANQLLKPIFPSQNADPESLNSGGMLLRAIESGEFVLSVSNMLGCDYIFINHKGFHPLLSPQQLHKTIRELLDILDTSPRQSLIVSADQETSGKLLFTRYDYVWENRKVVRVNPSLITNPEQNDFMQMMLECSSTC